MGVHASKHVADMLAPVLLTHAECKGSGPAAGKNANRAVGRLESMLHVEGLPRASLFILRKGDAVVHVVVALRAHVREPRHRSALEVLRQQTVGPSDGRVSVIVGS